MTRNAAPEDRELALAPLDENVDHVRGSPAGRLIIEYGDYECPYSRQAFRAIEQVERQLGGTMRWRAGPGGSSSPCPSASGTASARPAAGERPPGPTWRSGQ
jgi:hypothetical protein